MAKKTYTFKTTVTVDEVGSGIPGGKQLVAALKKHIREVVPTKDYFGTITKVTVVELN